MEKKVEDVVEVTEKSEYYIAKSVKRQLIKSAKRIRESNCDRVFVLTGREGSGKSTLALQFAAFVDPTFCLEDIVFTASAFEKRIRTCDKYKAVVFDECFNGLSSSGNLSKENKKMLRLLQECRQRNLFIFLVLPSFFLLSTYPALFRSDALFNVLVSKKNYNLRYYKIYNYEVKRKLYLMGKPMMDYSKPYIYRNHRFFAKIPKAINEKEYLAKKLKAFRDDGEMAELEEEGQSTKQRAICFMLLKEQLGLTYKELHVLLHEKGVELSVSAIRMAIKRQTGS